MSRAGWAGSDRTWFREIFENNRVWIREMLAQQLPADDRDRADELCQEVLLAAWEQRDVVPEDERPWLRDRTRKILRGYSRGRQRERATAAPWEVTECSSDPQQDAIDLDVDISAAIGRLPAADSGILKSHLRGFTHREIGVERGMKEDAVRKSFSRAREKLRLYLGLAQPGDPPSDDGESHR